MVIKLKANVRPKCLITSLMAEVPLGNWSTWRCVCKIEGNRAAVFRAFASRPFFILRADAAQIKAPSLFYFAYIHLVTILLLLSSTFYTAVFLLERLFSLVYAVLFKRNTFFTLLLYQGPYLKPEIEFKKTYESIFYLLSNVWITLE